MTARLNQAAKVPKMQKQANEPPARRPFWVKGEKKHEKSHFLGIRDTRRDTSFTNTLIYNTKTPILCT